MKKLFLATSAIIISFGLFAQDKMDDMKMSQTHKKTSMHKHMMKDCVMMKDGEMMMMKDGKMSKMEEDMTMSNGMVCMKNGTCKMKNGKTMVMKNGEKCDMDGKMSKMKMGKSTSMKHS
ncbi:MAG: hypothetical protein NVS9B7_07340 [Flavisolibacter sp.]